jgi:hydroxymethylglutaryl-CoA synthase
VSYGVSIPKYRIKASDISAAHGKPGQERALGIIDKAVPAKDQDTATLAVDAARQALARTDSASNAVGAVYVGSESHPYAVKPTAGIVGEAIGIDHGYTSADYEFACKAGTAAMQTVAGLVSSKMISQGLAIGADTAQSAAGDALEYSAAAAAGAFIIGTDTKKQPLIAEMVATVSRTYDVPDFWRRPSQSTPSHGGRFTGEPAYFRLISETFSDLLAETNTKVSDATHVVLHMPNAKFAVGVAKRLGVTDDQLKTGFTVKDIGNSYSACSPVGLAKVLDEAKPGDTIIMCSFGSGAGSDAFLWKVTGAITAYQKNEMFGASVQDQIDEKEYIDYTTYCKIEGKIS